MCQNRRTWTGLRDNEEAPSGPGRPFIHSSTHSLTPPFIPFLSASQAPGAVLSVGNACDRNTPRRLLRDEYNVPWAGAGRKKVFQAERRVWRPTQLPAVAGSGGGAGRDREHRSQDNSTSFPGQEDRNQGCVGNVRTLQDREKQEIHQQCGVNM